MDYVHLGRTGLKVSRLCLGTMNFGPQTTEAESFRIMDSALERGINFLDPIAAQRQQLLEQFLKHPALFGLYFHHQVGELFVGAADFEVLDFEPRSVRDHFIHDGFEEMRINQVAFGLYDFGVHREKS